MRYGHNIDAFNVVVTDLFDVIVENTPRDLAFRQPNRNLCGHLDKLLGECQ